MSDQSDYEQYANMGEPGLVFIPDGQAVSAVQGIPRIETNGTKRSAKYKELSSGKLNEELKSIWYLRQMALHFYRFGDLSSGQNSIIDMNWVDGAEGFLRVCCEGDMLSILDEYRNEVEGLLLNKGV